MAIPEIAIDRSLIQTEEEMLSRWGKFNKPLVSVFCITYNQEKYIKDALDGFLIQKTDFPFEVIVHNDCSTDLTGNIVDSYAQRYPSIIRVIHQKENQFSQNKSPGVLGITSQHAKGQFFALCEGDDYWIDSAKLQAQADCLLGNKNYSAVAHQAIKIFGKAGNKPGLFSDCNKKILDFNDLLWGRKFHTASVMLRGDIFRNNPLPAPIAAGDKALGFLLCSYGPIAYFSDVMCIYRKHEGGISSWVTADHMSTDLNMLPWLKKKIPKFPIMKYRSIIHYTVFCYPNEISLHMAGKHFVLFFVYSFSYFPKNIRLIVSSSIRMLQKIYKGNVYFLKTK